MLCFRVAVTVSAYVKLINIILHSLQEIWIGYNLPVGFVLVV
jgi:hypothetical protein